MKSTFVKPVLAASAIAVAALAFAQQPVRNVDPARHGNLAAAQTLIAEAFNKMTAAQQANEFDMGGHAAKAKELLRQASEEIKLAAVTANRR